VRRFVEEFQGDGQQEVAQELLAADFRNRTAGPGETDGRTGVLETFALLRTALPDLHVEVHDILADGDRVATRKTFHGTVPILLRRSGKRRPVAIGIMDIVRVRDGQIVEHWNSVDRLSAVRQLGVGGITRIVAHRIASRIGRARPG
jgi:predicted ester cyclase